MIAIHPLIFTAYRYFFSSVVQSSGVGIWRRGTAAYLVQSTWYTYRVQRFIPTAYSSIRLVNSPAVNVLDVSSAINASCRCCCNTRFASGIHITISHMVPENQVSSHLHMVITRNFRGSGHGVFKMSRVGSGRVRKCSKSHGSGRVGSRGYQISWVGSGRVKSS